MATFRSSEPLRLGITGGPRTGKSTLAMQHELPQFCTDPQPALPAPLVEYLPVGLDWGAQSLYVAENYLTRPGPWVIEGVTLPRALRKWRELHPGEPPPLDRLVVLTQPYERLSPGQASMAKGCATVLAELQDWLGDRLWNY